MKLQKLPSSHPDVTRKLYTTQSQSSHLKIIIRGRAWSGGTFTSHHSPYLQGAVTLCSLRDWLFGVSIANIDHLLPDKL